MTKEEYKAYKDKLTKYEIIEDKLQRVEAQYKSLQELDKGVNITSIAFNIGQYGESSRVLDLSMAELIPIVDMGISTMLSGYEQLIHGLKNQLKEL